MIEVAVICIVFVINLRGVLLVDLPQRQFFVQFVKFNMILKLIFQIEYDIEIIKKLSIILKYHYLLRLIFVV